jgi:hypothetical protein
MSEASFLASPKAWSNALYNVINSVALVNPIPLDLEIK